MDGIVFVANRLGYVREASNCGCASPAVRVLYFDTLPDTYQYRDRYVILKQYAHRDRNSYVHHCSTFRRTILPCDSNRRTSIHVYNLLGAVDEGVGN